MKKLFTMAMFATALMTGIQACAQRKIKAKGQALLQKSPKK